LTNFSNGKQIQKSLKSDFLKSEFQKTNIARIRGLERKPFQFLLLSFPLSNPYFPALSEKEESLLPYKVQMGPGINPVGLILCAFLTTPLTSIG
jgi:hypothetical protein